jgi:predicted dehydrogenase
MTKKYLLGLEGELIDSSTLSTLKIGVVGCGSHVYRNILPSLRFIPEASLEAVCDLKSEKAKLYAKEFGANRYFTNVTDLISSGCIDAALVVVGFDPVTGVPLYPQVIPEILEANIPVWMEKPPAKSCEQFDQMISARKDDSLPVQVGFKMMYAPAVQKTLELLNSSIFGGIQSFDFSYAVAFPEDIRNLTDPSSRRFLDDIVHVLSQTKMLFGSPEKIIYHRSRNNSAVGILQYDSGMIGTLRVIGGLEKIGPAEKLEVIGDGGLLILEHGERITFHESGDPGSYGRDINFIRKDNTHTHQWSPDLRRPLGALSLHSHSLYGYISELREFVDSIHSKREPAHGNVNDTREIMNMYDAFANSEDNFFTLGSKVRQGLLKESPSTIQTFVCSSCDGEMNVKDGWSVNCKSCGSTTQLCEVLHDTYGVDNHDIYTTLAGAAEEASLEINLPRLVISQSRGLRKEGARRLYVEFTPSANSSEKLFAKISPSGSRDSLNNERNVLLSKNTSPFVTPTVYRSVSGVLVTNYVRGTMLSSMIESYVNEDHELESRVHSLLGTIMTDLSEFHLKSRSKGDLERPIGRVHGDFDPWQILVADSSYTVIDWEDSIESAEQYSDVLSFIFMTAIIGSQSRKLSDRVTSVLNPEPRVSSLLRHALETYTESDNSTAKDLLNYTSKYSEGKLSRLERLGRNADDFIYSDLLAVSAKDFRWFNER